MKNIRGRIVKLLTEAEKGK